MDESPFGFEYSWDDLQPIRPLAATVCATQILGALCGLSASLYPSWFANLWAGGALAGFPGFVLGWLLQYQWDRESLTEHRVMVRRFALVALLLSLSVLVLPLERF